MSEITCRTEPDIAHVAQCLAPLLLPGDVLLLTGALASGKTYFVRELVHALGCPELVTSPTYAIANFYPTAAGSFVHVDAYRLSGVSEFRDLGLDDLESSIVAIEWGEKLESDFPDHLSIHLDFCGPADSQRILTISSSSRRWKSLTEKLEAQLKSQPA